MVNDDFEYRGGQHQQMTPSQTMKLSRDDRRGMFTSGQSPSMIDGWATSHRQNSQKLVPSSQQQEYHGQYLYNKLNEHTDGFTVSGRDMNNLQQTSSAYYLYDTAFHDVSDQQRVTAV